MTAPQLINRIRERISEPLRATDGADLVPPRVFPPATPAAIEATEQALGFVLPPFLRQLYLEVGNGGVGPGYGLSGVPGGTVADTGYHIVDLYQGFSAVREADQVWRWPERLLPVCHLGCAMYACVDCSSPSGAVTWWEPNPREDGEPLDRFLIPVASSLEDWLWAWVHDEDWMTIAYEASPLKRWLDEYYSQPVDEDQSHSS